MSHFDRSYMGCLCTYSEELGAGLMDGHNDYTVPPGQLCQQHYNLIGCHAVQACGWLIQKDHLCDDGHEVREGKKIKRNF